MVGTGRIELPTSSVSRKRSPTELRACRVWQERLNRLLCIAVIRLQSPPTIGSILCIAKYRKRSILLPISRLYVNRAGNGRGFSLEPDKPSVKILTTGHDSYNRSDIDENIERESR
jgi:hypothetical protein